MSSKKETCSSESLGATQLWRYGECRRGKELTRTERVTGYHALGSDRGGKRWSGKCGR